MEFWNRSNIHVEHLSKNKHFNKSGPFIKNPKAIYVSCHPISCTFHKEIFINYQDVSTNTYGVLCEMLKYSFRKPYYYSIGKC
jgi:hypothetical protein